MRKLSLSTALVSAALLASSCTSGSKEDGPPGALATEGAALYKQMCASCHGSRGEGGVGPGLRDWSRGEPELARIIGERMPMGAVGTCKGSCPPSIARHIVTAFKGPVVCDAAPASPRMTRLLTRREYEATARDLLGIGAPVGPACGGQTFTYDPQGRAVSRVHIAGSFNGWPGTIAGGGWPMQKSGNVFSLSRQLPDGSHLYKFVLDESQWIVDPQNPKRAPDGFGGDNSVLDVSCSSPPGPPGSGTLSFAELLRGFPADTRPDGFAFDDHGPSRVVSTVLAEETFRVARVLSESADITKLMVCGPHETAEVCARGFVSRFGRRAFRRPLTATETARYEALALGGGDRLKAARLTLRAMLTSPSFLYRTELGDRQPDGTYKLTPWETASALSYALWGSLPDDELFAAAEKGELRTSEGLEKQARRLLSSPRAKDQLGTFAVQWLGSEGISSVDKQASLYPEATPELRASLLEETRRFFTHVVFDGSHKYEELVTADYTFVDSNLARHYGMPAPSGAGLQRQKYADGFRAGILGHGAMLATTSHSDQSSPIRRGLFVRRRLLCQEFPVPPPNAGGVPKVDPGATTRDRFAQHTANATCASCHKYIDDLGFGFERFDAMGKVRSVENGKPIDSRGDMNDVERLGAGTRAPFDSLAQLGATLAGSEAAKACIVKQYYRFARGVTEDDVCATRPIEKRFAERSSDIRELVVGVVTSSDFTVRR